VLVGEQEWKPDLLAEYELNPAIIYVLDSAFRIAYCNLAWDRFALENGGNCVLRKEQIGRSAIDATPARLRPFYIAIYSRVLQYGEAADCVLQPRNPPPLSYARKAQGHGEGCVHRRNEFADSRRAAPRAGCPIRHRRIA
jgi:hypothetical protein